MRLIKALFAASCLSLAAGAVEAADLVVYEPPVAPAPAGFYVKGQVGWSFMDGGRPHSDDGFAAGIGVGYELDMLRVDLTGDYSGSYHIAPGTKGDVWTLLGNAYVSVPIVDVVAPFVGLGVGWGWLDGRHANRDGFTIAAHAGFTVGLSDRVDFDLGYRFRDIMLRGRDFTDHSVLAGIRIGF
jgi:opacity protein-like surface antigen